MYSSSIKESFGLISNSMSFSLLTVLSFLLGFIFSIKDNLLRKVIKTHREFDLTKSKGVVLKRI
jgi:hypothetical protein